MKLSRRLHAGLLTLAMAVSTTPLMQLDAAAAPAPTVSHASTKLEDQKTNAWGTFPDGNKISVWTEVLVSGKWLRSSTGTTNSIGGYTLPLTYAQDKAGTFEFRVAGRYADGTVVRTDSFKLTRLAKPTANTADERHVNVDTSAWGSVSGESDLRTWTEVKLSSGTWSRSQTTELDSRGRYTLPLTYGSSDAGTYTFRVATKHDNGMIARSDAFTLKRFGGTATANVSSPKMVDENTSVWGWLKGGAGIDVWSDVKVGDRWVRSQSATADSEGKYSLALTYGKGKAGTYTFRVGGRYPDGTIVHTDTVELVRKAPAPTTPTTGSGTKYDWMRAAGIPESQWQYADYIVSRESGWNPRAVNPYSGACGLAQAYPCSKLGPNWYDPVVALKWQYNYVTERYGGYQGAYNFWVRNRWY